MLSWPSLTPTSNGGGSTKPRTINPAPRDRRLPQRGELYFQSRAWGESRSWRSSLFLCSNNPHSSESIVDHPLGSHLSRRLPQSRLFHLSPKYLSDLDLSVRSRSTNINTKCPKLRTRGPPERSFTPQHSQRSGRSTPVANRAPTTGWTSNRCWITLLVNFSQSFKESLGNGFSPTHDVYRSVMRPHSSLYSFPS